MDNTIYKKFAAVCLCVLTIEAVRKDLPSYFPNCKRYDPNLNECLLKATEQVRPYLIKGVPELNFPPFEPFHLPEVSLEQGTSALNFKALLKNIKVDGLGSYKFSQFDFDVPNLQFFCKATIGTLNLTGDYTITGRILIAPIEGKGVFNAKIDSCNVTVYQKIKIVQKRGVDFVEPVITNSSIEVGGPQAVLDGLFQGNEELNNVTNRVINENVGVLFEELKPVIEKVITSVMEDLLLRTLEDNVPFDKLYPKQ